MDRMTGITSTENHQIVVAATRVAAAAPLKQGQYVHAAQVPWTLIHELREALNAADVDWRRWKS
jgi:hypothetical protein